MNIILIILVFGVIVFFHEFGHFIVAKMNKIAVMEFSIGMGPAIFSIQKKETKYSLRLLPIGGYCMMMGEDGESEQRVAVALTGTVKRSEPSVRTTLPVISGLAETSHSSIREISSAKYPESSMVLFVSRYATTP